MFRFFEGIDRYSEDKAFELFLRSEFWRDLRSAVELRKKSFHERIDSDETTLKKLKDKYRPDGECPSELFPLVSKDLQENYMAMHRQICSLLYG